MNLPSWIKAQPDGVLIALKVQPRASRCSIGPVLGHELKLSVTAPPVDAAANEHVVKLIAEALDCPRGAVQIVRGQTSRHKTIRVTGMAAAEVRSLLQAEQA